MESEVENRPLVISFFPNIFTNLLSYVGHHSQHKGDCREEAIRS